MAKGILKLVFKPKDVVDGKFRVLKKLGEGGCGSVYRCHLLRDPARLVAVKVLENPTDLPRFRREQRMMASIDSLYVVRGLGQGHHEVHPYLVMEFMAGGSLRDLLDQRGTLGTEEASWAVIMAIRGLRAARTVHRDLKPENLLLTQAPDGTVKLEAGEVRRASVVKVADFGLAKSQDRNSMSLTNSGHVMGTPLYMSPEQCRNTKTVTLSSDIYALGVILYELVSGKVPFDADSPYEIMKMHCEVQPTWPRLERRLKAVIERCMQKDPTQRYRSLRDLETDLALIAGIARPANDEEIGTRLGPNWWLLIGGMILFAVLAWALRDRLWEAAEDWFAPSAPVQQPRQPSRPAL